jgi:hypothetical protein
MEKKKCDRGLDFKETLARAPKTTRAMKGYSKNSNPLAAYIKSSTAYQNVQGW